MQRAKYYIKGIDLEGNNFALKFNAIQCYKSVTGGCFSLISLILIIAIFIFKLYGIIQLDETNVESTISRTDFSIVDLKDLKFKLTLDAGGVKNRTSIKKQQQFKYGVNVTIQINKWTMINGNPKETIEEYMMDQDQARHFIIPTMISESQEFNSSVYGRIDFAANDQTPDGDYYRRIGIKVKKCLPQKNQTCLDYPEQLIASVFFLNHVIDPYQKQLQNIVTEDTNYRGYMAPSYLLNDTQIDFNFFFKKIEVTYDSSILPEIVYSLFTKQTQKKDSWFYDQQTETTSLYFGQKSSTLFRVRLKRSIYTNVYKKSFKKLDIMLAEVFALVGIIFIVKHVLYGGYNQWSFSQKRLKLMGQPNKNISIWRYYAHCLKSFWISLREIICCRNLDFGEKQNYLDYYSLLRKVQFLENKIKVLTKQNNLYLMSQEPNNDVHGINADYQGPQNQSTEQIKEPLIHQKQKHEYRHTTN